MESKELAKKISDEIVQYPSMVQNLIKGTLDVMKNEVKEGKIILSELFESEEKFLQTITDIIDLNTNTGVLDPFDNKFIRQAVDRTIKPMLIKFFGVDWLSDLRKIFS